MSVLPRIEKLAAQHKIEQFDCGSEPLNRFLYRFALQNQRAGASQTYVAVEDGRVWGYHTLAFGEIAHDDAPNRLKAGLARPPVPVMVLARLAVDRDRQGRGFGAGLLLDALRRTVQAADIAGLRAMVAHAKDENAHAFYRAYDFAPSPSDPLHLYALLKDVRRLLADAG